MADNLFYIVTIWTPPSLEPKIRLILRQLTAPVEKIEINDEV
jgi:hypothetical protein